MVFVDATSLVYLVVSFPAHTSAINELDCIETLSWMQRLQ